MGYCDPEYAETGLLKKESDVYSLGVVLFEVLCGRLCINYNKNIRQSQFLIGVVRQHYQENRIQELVFGNIKDGIDPESLETFCTIAYRCLDRNINKRPLMAEVVEKLETALEYQREKQRKSQRKNAYIFGSPLPSDQSFRQFLGRSERRL
ncbi:hypothetical protein L1887_27945 [Cichorium endivia]|nr:hypothetical protein L1887_27945 [Cichorium endivia]